EALRAKRLDLAFVRSPVGDSGGLTIETMLVEDMVAALPIDHPLAEQGKRKSIALHALAEESFIMTRRPNGPGLYDTIIAACHAAGFSP
ncbi:LysR substrate-binding domain-containing protein, partial [Salmonella enterica]